MSKRGKENAIENENSEVDINQMEKDFMMNLDNTEMSYLIKMGLFKSESEERDSTENETNLFEKVQEMNKGLEASIRATLTHYRKICLKYAQGNGNQGMTSQITNTHKQDKRMQKKEVQENGDNEDAISSNLLQICIWLESKFHAK